MKNLTLSIKTVAVLFCCTFFFQVCVAQNVIDSKAQTAQDSIDVKKGPDATKSHLVPHVALTGANDSKTIKGISTNLLIYNSATAGEVPNKVYPGYYHNVGTTEAPVWKRVDVTTKEAVKPK